MEEILSSIRRIIAEDEPASGVSGAAKAAGGASTMPALPDEDDDDVLELTEIVGGPEPSRPQPASAPPSPPNVPPAVESAHTTMEPSPMPVPAAESLISPVVASASTQAFARLARAATADDRKDVAAAGVTVEQLVVDLLTPMLRDWLDKHLPEIVERVVEQEVKKLARRAELM